MIKRISIFVMIFAICVFAENTPAAAPAVAPATAAPAAAPAPQPSDTAAVRALHATPQQPEQDSVAVEQVATEAAPAAEPVAVAPVAPVPAPAAPAPAKETIIENPIEFAIVSAVFLATVLLITLTGD